MLSASRTFGGRTGICNCWPQTPQWAYWPAADSGTPSVVMQRGQRKRSIGESSGARDRCDTEG